jgi:putative colanic acid biosynthesis acetyltransferase WcaF
MSSAPEIRKEGSYSGVKLSSYEDPRPMGYLFRRLLWACVQLPFLLRIPRVLSPIRIALLRMFGAQIGQRCLVGSARIWIPWNLHMGEYSAIGDSAEIYNLAPVHIGSNSVVSQRSYICTATHDYTKPNFPIYSVPITIGSSAWIAAGVFIAPGVNVGDGAVVGAFSVVTKDVLSWTVSVGNPCRAVKSRQIEDPKVAELNAAAPSEGIEFAEDIDINGRQATR